MGRWKIDAETVLAASRTGAWVVERLCYAAKMAFVSRNRPAKIGWSACGRSHGLDLVWLDTRRVAISGNSNQAITLRVVTAALGVSMYMYNGGEKAVGINQQSPCR